METVLALIGVVLGAARSERSDRFAEATERLRRAIQAAGGE